MKIKELISWSKKEFSGLPWRKNRSLYNTLVSEIMLQQTTVSTVKNHFEKFIHKFPDLKSLANASEEELLIAWKGLGYYRRAKNLRKIAIKVENDFNGMIPDEKKELLKISGIGPYTAGALVGIGMDQKSLAIDANLERVISRLFAIKLPKGLKLQSEILDLFEKNKILNFNNISYRELNEALMDLGRTYCQARRASCELCPLQKDCKAFKDLSPLKYPEQKEILKKDEHELDLLRCYVIKKDKLLVYKKNENEWLSGQYEVPTFVLKSSDKNLRQYPGLNKAISIVELPIFKTGITKYKIRNYILKITEVEFKKFELSRNYEWKSCHDINANFSTATLKGLKKI